MKYRNVDTGEVFTLEELKELYEQFKWEISDNPVDFEEYLEDLLNQGRAGIGGLVEVEEEGGENKTMKRRESDHITFDRVCDGEVFSHTGYEVLLDGEWRWEMASTTTGEVAYF